MVTLEPVRIHWIKDDGFDDPGDLCAHSPVRFEIDNEVIVRPQDGDWTVSASAIFLLRALNRDHTKASPVGDQIFPCCGHGIFDVGKPEVLICGCPSGIDLEIRHVDECYFIVTDDGREFRIPAEQWREAVFNYSDQVMRFYEKSVSKEPCDEENRKAFQTMMAEWRRLRSVPSKLKLDAGQDRKSIYVPSSPMSDPRNPKAVNTCFADSCLPQASFDEGQWLLLDDGSPRSNSQFMIIIRRISLMAFGLLSCVVGLVSVLVSIMLMVANLSDINNIGGRVIMTAWLFILTEILLAFGITAFLLGLRCICGPKEWLSRIMDVCWKKAIKYALAIPVFVFGSIAVLKLIDWLLR